MKDQTIRRLRLTSLMVAFSIVGILFVAYPLWAQ